MNKKIEELTEIELKAFAYEHMLQLEHSQAAILAIKNELLKRQQEGNAIPVVEPQVETPPPPKKK